MDGSLNQMGMRGEEAVSFTEQYTASYVVEDTVLITVRLRSLCHLSACDFDFAIWMVGGWVER